MVSPMRAWHLSPLLIANSGPAWAQFNADAFEQGAGFSGANLTTLIASIVFVLATIGLAWISVSTFRNWADGQASLFGAGALIFRAVALLILISVLLR